MKVLTHEVEDVAGGFGAYDVGYGMGLCARAAFTTFTEMGMLYTPIL